MGKEQIPHTEFSFTLPQGLIDAKGDIHRQGMMRPATGEDEIYAQKDPRVQEHPDYSLFVILSRVITNLGNFSSLTPELLEQLFLLDFLYLHQVYSEVNQYSGGWFASGEL